MRIIPLHRLHFVLADQSGAIPVNDLSMKGIGLQNNEVTAGLKVGDHVKARLTIMNKTVPVVLQVVFVADRIGCQFQQAPSELVSLILEYLRFEAAAISLSKVDSRHMKTDVTGDANWFVDDDNNELYFVKKDGRIVNFHLAVLGNYVEWAEGHALRYGTVLRTGERKTYKMSDLINYSKEPIEMGDLLERLFANISQLQADDKKHLLNALAKN